MVSVLRSQWQTSLDRTAFEVWAGAGEGTESNRLAGR